MMANIRYYLQFFGGDRDGDLLASMLDLLKIIMLPVALLWMSWLKYRGVEYVLVNYRWVFVVLFLLPVSLVYDLFFYARNWLIFRMNSAPDKHEEKVRRVQQQVRTVLMSQKPICRVFPGYAVLLLSSDTVNVIFRPYGRKLSVKFRYFPSVRTKS